ncbi:protein of unknown function [Pararobbsia alpina]
MSMKLCCPERTRRATWLAGPISPRIRGSETQQADACGDTWLLTGTRRKISQHQSAGPYAVDLRSARSFANATGGHSETIRAGRAVTTDDSTIARLAPRAPDALSGYSQWTCESTRFPFVASLRLTTL